MWEFVMSILDNLSGIFMNILTAIKNDLLFPHQPRTLEEQLFSKVRGQSSLIHSQQDRLSYQAGVIKDQSRGISERDDLLTQKEKEIKNLKKTNRSLEFQLQEAASRYKRWR